MNVTDSAEFVNVTFPPVESNDSTTERFINIPTAVYAGILSVIGSIGNTIVLYVYIFKSKQSTFGTFIIFLAVFDVISSFIAMPFDVMNLVLPSGFQGCKPLVFIGTTNALASSFILLAIAVLRYKAVCEPLKQNISVIQARRISLISLGIALTLSWPSAVMITNMPTHLKEGMFVITCSSDNNFKDTFYPLIFYGILFLLFVVVFVSLVVLYGIIGRRLWLRKKYGPTLSPIHKDKSIKQSSHYSCEGFSQSVSNETVDDEQTDVTPNQCSAKSRDQSSVITEMSYTDSEKTDEPGSIMKDRSYSDSSRLSECSSKSELPKVQIIELEVQSSKSSIAVLGQSVSKHVPTKRHRRNASKNQNVFKMLFIVTITFLLSYVPHLSLMLYEAVGSDLDVTPLGESFVGIVIRSFFINCVSNPIIYGFCNKTFRDETSAIFQRIRKCFHIA